MNISYKYLAIAIFFSCNVFNSIAQDPFEVDIYVTGITETQSTGSITLTPSGGTPPYTYEWEHDGELEGNVADGLALGTYSVIIRDDLENEVERKIGVGYRVEWLDLVESSYSDGVLAKTSSVANWNSSALSNQVLPANEDGWFEYILDEIEGIKMIGYWNGLDPITSYNNLSYGLYVYPNSTTYVWEGSGSYENVANKKGDVFRIERKGDKIIYTQNGQVIREKNTNRDQEMLIMAPMMDPTSKYINVMSSFNTKKIRTSFDKDWLTDESSTTDVTVSVWGGKSPYIVKWGLEPGAYEGITKTVGVGDHIVHITDALGNEEIDTVTVGYRVEWLDLVESSYSDGVLAKTSSVANWNSSALSNQVLPANEDGWFEYILDEIEGIKMIGYWNGLDPITSYNNLSYGLYVYPNSTTYVWEGSGSYENVANKKGDVFRIERKGDKIIYTQNGQVIREKNTNRDQEMLIMAPMMDPTSKYINVMSSFNTKKIRTSFDKDWLTDESSTTDVTVSVWGGKSPYIVKWGLEPGAYEGITKTVGVGDHIVHITDALGNEEIDTVTVGYRVEWLDLVESSYSDGVLAKTSSVANWNSSALSNQVLPANEDGWFEYILDEIEGIKMIGYWNGLDPKTSYNNLSYGLYVYPNSTTYVWEGSGSYENVANKKGDVFRIERKGDKIIYTQNGQVIREKNTNRDQEMLIMAPMMDPTSKYINVMSSFNTKKIRTSFDKDWLTDESSTTDVTVSVWGGKSPYIVKWGLEPGAYEGITKTVGVGDHIVHITDALGNEEIDTVTVGYRVEWLDLVESSYSDGVLAKTSSVANWNSSALSNQVLPANEDGWFEYILDEIEGIKMIGYWNGLDPITSYNNLSYGLYVYPNSTTYVWEGSGSYENVANKKGDVFRIERKGDIK